MKATGPAEMVKSPEKGTPGVRVMCGYVDGPNAGQTIEWIGWLSDATVARTAESLANMGYDGSDLTTVTKNSFQGVTEEEEYTNTAGEVKSRPRLKWINGASRMVAMSSAEVAGAKDRLKSALIAAKAKTSAPSNPADEPQF